jgi:hypothetical protein
MKTSELTGAALNWAVAKCEGELPRILGNHTVTESEAGIRRYLITITLECHDEADEIYSPSTDWAQGGPIIEREQIHLSGGSARTFNKNNLPDDPWSEMFYVSWLEGTTILEAAMRCFVASRFGNEIDIPDKLA